MPMRKTRVRERRPRIEKTSRPTDLVCLIFSRPNYDAALNLVQTYLPSAGHYIHITRARGLEFDTKQSPTISNAELVQLGLVR